ncbi:MAG: hypothetical protein ACRCXZ_06235 [Patescibacteria group bacterium]
MENNNLITKSDQPQIVGYLKKSYQKDQYNFTSPNGKEYGSFTLSMKNQNGGYDNYYCSTFNLKLIDKLESWDSHLIKTTQYESKTNDKGYVNYTVSNFDEVYATKNQNPKVEAKVIAEEVLTVINADDLNVQMPF